MEVNSLNSASSGTSGFGLGGGALTTPLYLLGNPSQPLEAATKQYVDAIVNSIPTSLITSGTMDAQRFPSLSGDVDNAQGSGVLTLKTGTLAAGTYTKAIVSGKGFVTDASQITVDDIPPVSWNLFATGRPTTLSGYGITDAVAKAGGAMTGYLSLQTTASQSLHAVNKTYVDNKILNSSGMPTGSIMTSPSTSSQTGFLRCNGGEVSKTTYANLYAIIGDAYSYTQFSVPGEGKPWLNQYQINSQQDGVLGPWGTGPALPASLVSATSLVTKSRVYFFGGYDSTGTSAAFAYYAPINADGTLGAWVSFTSGLPAIGAPQTIVTKNRAYMLGGAYSFSGTDTVSNAIYTATIDDYGVLSSWTNSGQTLPANVCEAAAFVTMGRVYLIGGRLAGTANSNAIYTAPINADGTLGAFVSAGTFPVAQAWGTAVVTKNRVYIVGGYYHATNTPQSSIYTAPINADGTLGTWTATTSFPTTMFGADVFVVKSRVYFIGGYTASNAQTSAVYSAVINADGSLGTWVLQNTLPVALGSAQVVVTKNRLHVLGGMTSGSTARLNTDYHCSIYGGLSDYSPYYNGSIAVTASGNFRVPDYTAKESTYNKYFIKI